MKSVERIRNDSWKTDESLKNDLERYVANRFLRKEILSHMMKDYSQYAWSIKTLSRRISYFDIKFINYNVSLSDVEEAVGSELAGPGEKLGYRAMTNKVRVKHNLNVPRNLVYNVMSELDPEGLENRGNVGKKRQIPRKQAFSSYVS